MTKWTLVVGPAPASPGESSALAVYGGLSRSAPRPLMRPPSFRPQGPLCPHPTWPRLGNKLKTEPLAQVFGRPNFLKLVPKLG